MGWKGVRRDVPVGTVGRKVAVRVRQWFDSRYICIAIPNSF